MEDLKMKLSAYVRNRQTKNFELIIRDCYKTKEAFWIDLELNGYTVIRISTNRDLAAMDDGFETFAAMKKQEAWVMKNFNHHSVFYTRIQEINEIEL